jgi:uncharacterized membrane protein SirB2
MLRLLLWILALCFFIIAVNLATNYDFQRHAQRRTQTFSLSAHPRIDKYVPQRAHEIAARLRRTLGIESSWPTWFARKIVSVVFFGGAGALGIWLVRHKGEPISTKLTLVSVLAATALSGLIELAQVGEPISDVVLDLALGILGGYVAALTLRWILRAHAT